MLEGLRGRGSERGWRGAVRGNRRRGGGGREGEDSKGEISLEEEVDFKAVTAYTCSEKQEEHES